MVHIGVLVEQFRSCKSPCLTGISGGTATPWRTMLVYCSSHWSHLNPFRCLGESSRAQQCAWFCWCTVEAVLMFTSIGLAGWSGANTTMWWCTAWTIEITLINLLGKRERLERNNMVVSVGLMLKRILTSKSIRLAGGGRCERNHVMVHVGLLLKPFEPFTSICLAGGSGANATMWWFVLVYCTGWFEPLEPSKSICLAGGSGSKTTMWWNMLEHCSSH